MRAIEVILKQLGGVNDAYHDVADDLTDAEWTTRLFPGCNLLGFTLWHLPRTQDWAVHTAIGGSPEVIAQPAWRDRGALQTPGIGAGLALEDADRVAHEVLRADVLAYADAVHRAIVAWATSLDDSDLDRVPDMALHEAPYPAYQQPTFRAEVAHLAGMPAWRFLLGPCIGHARSHLGELAILKQALRSR